MKIQRSFKDEGAKLYVVPTPIGNLEDITLRALTVLREVDYIAAEDTRHTKSLLNHFEITKPLVSYHEHNERERAKKIIRDIEAGKAVALVSDAGMPAISDPGVPLVQNAIEAGIDLVVLPGANAALTALVGSGLRTNKFLFYGFLPRKNKEKLAALEELGQFEGTLIFYESPYRLKQTLETIFMKFGNRRITIARELTKRFEEYVRGPIDEVIAWSEGREIKGEICLLLEGASGGDSEDELWWTHLGVREHVDYYIEEKGFSTKEAIKEVAKDRRMNRREVYSIYHIR